MREDLGVKPKKDKKEKAKEKEERKRLQRERKHRKHRSRSVRYSRTPSPSTKRLDRGWSPIDRGRSRSRSPYGKRSRSPSPRRKSPTPKRSRYSPPPAPHAQNGQTSGYTQNGADRATRLAAMQVNANSTSEDRQKRLAALLEKEKADLAADERAREKSKGMSSFLSQEQKRVFGGTGGLEDRIRRGKVGMVVEAD